MSDKQSFANIKFVVMDDDKLNYKLQILLMSLGYRWYSDTVNEESKNKLLAPHDYECIHTDDSGALGWSHVKDNLCTEPTINAQRFIEEKVEALQGNIPSHFTGLKFKVNKDTQLRNSLYTILLELGYTPTGTKEDEGDPICKYVYVNPYGELILGWLDSIFEGSTYTEVDISNLELSNTLAFTVGDVPASELDSVKYENQCLHALVSHLMDTASSLNKDKVEGTNQEDKVISNLLNIMNDV